MNANFFKQYENEVASLGGRKPKLLLHVCCAPCSSHSLEEVARFFDVTVFFYNPNITDQREYVFRRDELKRLLRQMPEASGTGFIEGKYEPERFLSAVKGLENEPEGGKRCKVCFSLRLAEAAKVAKEQGFEYVTTTLTISPLKNAALLNEIGALQAQKEGVKWLPSDFKKKDGYKRSVELSRQYGLYRQDYCGCEFSKNPEKQQKEI